MCRKKVDWVDTLMCLGAPILLCALIGTPVGCVIMEARKDARIHAHNQTLPLKNWHIRIVSPTGYQGVDFVVKSKIKPRIYRHYNDTVSFVNENNESLPAPTSTLPAGWIVLIEESPILPEVAPPTVEL